MFVKVPDKRYQGNFMSKTQIYLLICFSYPDALSLLASGRINLNPLITHHFRIENSEEAFKLAASKVGNPIKIMINCDIGF